MTSASSTTFSDIVWGRDRSPALGMLESTFSRQVQKYVESRGWWVVKYHASQYTKKGIPDLIACFRGRFVGLELKTGSSLSQWQIKVGADIMSAGGYWACVTPDTYQEEVARVEDEVLRDNLGGL
jgi:hypothetical protein